MGVAIQAIVSLAMDNATENGIAQVDELFLWIDATQSALP